MLCSPEAFGFSESVVSPRLRIHRKLIAFDLSVLRLINSADPIDVRVTAELFAAFRALPPDLRDAVPDSTAFDLPLSRLLAIEAVLDDGPSSIPARAVWIHQLRLGATSVELAA